MFVLTVCFIVYFGKCFVMSVWVWHSVSYFLRWVTLDNIFKGSAIFCPDNVTMHMRRRLHIASNAQCMCRLVLLHEIKRSPLC